ncbi:MAG: SGNH/GDSL hydrolase family protein, partial [Bacteroidota bacterium]
ATMRSDNDWTVRIVSVGGDNTPRVLRRFGSDLVSACGSYVVFGLSLANEGIRNGDQRIFDQFRDNLRTLIDNSRAVGLQPVVVSNYPRSDYDAQDYQFIKDMNLLIHQWDVPSVNVLGAVDDGAGRWAAGFQDDLGHPNLAGHQEFFHAFVPSLFDALAAGKPQPVQQRDPQGIRMFIPDQRLSFEPEDTLHSFSLAFTAAVRKVGELARFVTQDGRTASLAVNTLGQLTYSSTAGEITHSADLGDALPHHILLTHNYARGRTELFVDGKVADTGLAERVIATEFRVGVRPEGGQADFTVANLTFWRSSLNPDEATVAATGEALLQGSLEIYAPLAPE